MRVAYFVHDLADPAVGKRVRMLRAGGAEVTVLGFHRGETVPVLEGAAAVIDLGRTYDGRFRQRIGKVLSQLCRISALRSALAGADTIMARNLEMLVIAAGARHRLRPDAGLVYECLDIHRLMLGDGAVGVLLRGLERRLMAACDVMIVSSPAFLRSYFEPRQGLGGDLRLSVRLVENKVFEPVAQPKAPTVARPAGPPWRIGWYGALRCRKSLDILRELVCRRPDLVRISLRGRPSRAEFDDFDRQTRETPGLAFDGAYAARDLPALYGDVHFAWAIDYFESGANSEWLLPNRIYESGRYGVVPLALAKVETGAWLARHGLGLRMSDPDELEALLEAMTPGRYEALAATVRAAPQDLFVAGLDDCRALVAALAPSPGHDRKQKGTANGTVLGANCSQANLH
jgi:succinoglycan biosynthesis protein ExoL